jgi:aspartyl-tRNA(Asn)/glutamyl-tRNA(Gln) amidotransferase subunit A
VGLPKQYFLKDAQIGINETVITAAKVLEKLGATLIEVETMDPKYSIAVYTVIQRSEVSSNLARMDGIRFGLGREAFNEENIRRIMLGTYTLQAGYYDAYYKKAQEVRTLIINDFAKLFDKVDLLLSPTMPSVAPKIGVTKGQAMYGELADVLAEPSAMAGLPAISIPCGFLEDLPVGMQLIGPMWSEEMILNIAEDFEKNTDWHKEKPKL